ncbi:hypothetical protein ACFL15_00200 [Patescibacteria group bacterium]
MPFIEIKGVPSNMSSDELELLENNLVKGLSEAMGVPESQCHVFLPRELQRPLRKNHMLYARIDTGFFQGATGGVVKKATEAVGNILFGAFKARFSVEVFPLPLDGTNKTYIKRAEG